MRTLPRSLRLSLVALMLSLAWLETASAPLYAESKSGSGKVTSVASNGDLHLSNGQKLRLMGIDLPGTTRCYGDERLAYMREQLEGKYVTYTVEKSDLLGKSLAYVNNSGDVAADLIHSGYGFALLSFSYSNQDRYIRAQESAKTHRRGLWSACDVDCDPRGCATESAIFSCSR